MYSAASAVLLTELLKGGISLGIAGYNAFNVQSAHLADDYTSADERLEEKRLLDSSWQEGWQSGRLTRAVHKLGRDVFR